MEHLPHGLDSIADVWDFADPEGSAAKFRTLATTAEMADEFEYAAEARTQLARCLGLQGQFVEGHAVLDDLASTATHMGERATVRMLLERGRLLNSAGDPPGAAPLFVAAWEAARHSKDDDLAVDAAHMLGIVEAPTAAREWNQRAMDLAASSRDPAAHRWKASLLNNHGWMLHDAGEYVDALHYFEEALAARRATGTISSTRHAEWAVARCLRSLGRIEDALAAQAALLAELPDDGFVHEEVAECLFALGRSLEARPHFAAAHRLLSNDESVARDPARLARLADLAAAG